MLAAVARTPKTDAIQYGFAHHLALAGGSQRRFALPLELRRESLGRLAWCGVPLVLGGVAALLLLAAAGNSASAAAPAAARTSTTITFPGCAPTIQECLNAAAEGDTLVIQPGTYHVSLALHRAINLTGVNSGTVILDALPNQRVLTVNEPTIIHSFVISGLTLAGGQATDLGDLGSGAFISIPIEAELNNVIFSNNISATYGGGLYVTGGAHLVNVTFSHNSAITNGGGLFLYGAANIDGGLFVNNQCTGINCVGGGLAIFSALVVKNTRFIGNGATHAGGGVATGDSVDISNSLFQDNFCLVYTCSSAGLVAFPVFSSGPLTLSNTRFISNSAPLGQGALFSAVPTTINGGLFQDNHCSDPTCQGSALYLYQAALALTGTQFLSNSAQADGGSVYVYTATISGALFQNNQCGELSCHGGGLYAAGPLTLNDSRFISNTAGENGGGLYAAQAVRLTNGQFTNNQSGSDGGGLYALDTSDLSGGLFQTNRCLSGGCGGGGMFASSALALDGAEFVNNQAQGGGGGLEALQGATVSGALFQSNHSESGGGLYADNGAALTSTIFLSNTASGSGGGFTLFAGDARVVNSLFAGNAAGGSGALRLGQGSAGNYTILFTTLAGGSGAGVEVLGGNLGVTDSIISGYTIGIKVTAGTGRESHNLFFANGSNTAGAVTAGGGSLTSNPKFVNPAASDYHLTRTSPAIDMGMNAGVTTDIDGDHRPQGAGFDVGFDEYLARLFLALVRR